MLMQKILIVDDSEADHLLMAALVKKHAGLACEYATNGLEAIAQIKNDKRNEIAVVLLDLSMPTMDGHTVLPQILELRPNMQIIAITASNDPKTIVDIIRLGAADYLLKPIEPNLFANALMKAVQRHRLQNEIDNISRQSTASIQFSDLIGQSPVMQTCIKLGERAAVSDITVLITGESGTGKEMLARAIHSRSVRSKEPFVAVNCGALPKDLVESILFGHKRGAFTGAFADAKGKFLEANGGTLFLDEVGELQLETQVKLLRVLQQNEIEPVGAGKTVPINVRIIAATNRNPAMAVKSGHMREDLFYRLNVFPIRMPPLRQRMEDIDELSDHFLKHYAATEGKIIKGFDHDAAEWMVAHDWPGNVRELENAIFRAVLLCDHGRIKLEHLLYDQTYQRDELPSSPTSIKAAQTLMQIDLLDQSGGFKNMNDINLEIENLALRFYKNDYSQAAQQLGIGKSTLYRHRQNIHRLR